MRELSKRSERKFIPTAVVVTVVDAVTPTTATDTDVIVAVVTAAGVADVSLHCPG
jgi:hypothetical protein